MSDGDEFDCFTIEPASYGEGFVVYGHGRYPRWSVLAGQSRRSCLEEFDTLEEAKKEWPHADPSESTRPVTFGKSLSELSGLSSTPPTWFDPRNAGERWNADD